MLALAEHQVIEQGLDWVFCDTDSLAIGNTRDLPHDEFIAKALRVREWFKDLNPYGEDKPILQLEKVNFPPGKRDDLQALDPPFCLAVSAKRYVSVQPAERRRRHPQGFRTRPRAFDARPMMNLPPSAASASRGWAFRFGRRTYGRRSFAPLTAISRTRRASWRCLDSMRLPRANMQRRRRSCSDGSMGITSNSRADTLFSLSVFSCRCKRSRESKWPRTSLTPFRMNFGVGASRGRRRRISRSPARPRITPSIVSGAMPFRRPG